MNQLDALLAVLCCFWALRGWQRGAIREAFAALGLVTGLVLAPRLAPPITVELLRQGLEPKVFATWLAFPIAFLAVYAVCRLVGFGLHRAVRVVALGGVNRVIGILLGVAKGLALAGVTILVVERMSPPGWYESMVTGSRAVRPLSQAAHAVARALGLDPTRLTPPTREAAQAADAQRSLGRSASAT